MFASELFPAIAPFIRLRLTTMDTHIADGKLKELHIEDATVQANAGTVEYELDAAAEKRLLRKIDLHVVPILWFLFMYVGCAPV